MYHSRRTLFSLLTFLALFGGATLWGAPTFVSAEDASTQHVHPVGMTSHSPGWAEKLKGQTIVEDAMEGRAERAALVEQQHERLMQQMQQDLEQNGTNTGPLIPCP